MDLKSRICKHPGYNKSYQKEFEIPCSFCGGNQTLKKIFYCYSITVVCIFSPSLYPPPWFGPCVLYSSSRKPVSPLPPPRSPLAIVRLFLTSVSLVIFCLLWKSDFLNWILENSIEDLLSVWALGYLKMSWMVSNISVITTCTFHIEMHLLLYLLFRSVVALCCPGTTSDA